MKKHPSLFPSPLPARAGAALGTMQRAVQRAARRGALLSLGGLMGWAASMAPGPAAAQSSGNFCIVRTPALQGSYVGGCVSGLAQGRGRAQGTDRYEGDWLEGQPHGEGLYTFADGNRLEGQFEAGQVHGRARLIYANGDVLRGDFRHNALFGVGQVTRPDGTVVAVQLREGVLVAVQVPAPAPAPTPAPQPTPAPAPAPAPPPIAPATPVPAQALGGDACGERLRLQVTDLQRRGPGVVEITVHYENLTNAELRSDIHPRYGKATYLVDEEGAKWELTNVQGERLLMPGIRSRTLLVFQRAIGGQAAQRFVLSNPVLIQVARGGALAGLNGWCEFRVRDLRPTGTL